MRKRPVNQACIDNCMMGHALDGMCVGLVLTSEAGRILWINRAGEQTLGLSKDRSRGKLLAQVIKDPHLAAFWHKARATKETLLDGITIQYPHPADLKINATRCLDFGGTSIGRVLLFCDVSRERAAQVELSQEVADRLIGLACQNQVMSEPAAGLTPAELRVLRLIGSGIGNDEIANKLDVAPSTVRSHLKHIYRKLNLRTRAEAVSYAVKNRFA